MLEELIDSLVPAVHRENELNLPAVILSECEESTQT